MDVLFAHRGGTPAFKQLPKHPAITRDLALVADDAVPARRHRVGASVRLPAKALESLTLFDVYTGEHMAPGQKESGVQSGSARGGPHAHRRRSRKRREKGTGEPGGNRRGAAQLKWGSNRNGAAGKPSANASQALLCRQPQIPIAAFLPQMLASAALLGYNID